MPDHDIDVLLAAAKNGSEIEFPAGWGQGRATFGGVPAGVLAAHALAEVNANEADLRSFTVNFVGPVSQGPARLTAEVLRQGKSATQLEARILQKDDDGVETVRAVGLVTLGRSRDSILEVPGVTPPQQLSAPAELEPFPIIPGLTPDFMQWLDMRIAYGTGPFTGSDSADMSGYMKFREPPTALTLPHLITLMDAWPPAPSQMLKELANVSSMTWTMEFVAPVNGGPDDFWRYDVVTKAARDGYGHTDATISTVDGRVVALSRQTVAIFA